MPIHRSWDVGQEESLFNEKLDIFGCFLVERASHYGTFFSTLREMPMDFWVAPGKTSNSGYK
ncbi:MAG: hypothetical protein KAW09_07295 [Thermoplasmata archaeon]|nr:hypothetical protein [Thermoplasmata archaeon]